MDDTVTVEALLQMGCTIRPSRVWTKAAYDQRDMVVAYSTSLPDGLMKWRYMGKYRPLFRVKARAAPE